MNKFMEEAIRLSEDNIISNAGGPFGAVVVKDGKVIGRGANRVILRHDPTAHAEVMAIREACKNLNTYDLTGCVLYTTCYPCPMCLSAIIWSNIKVVYYANNKEDAAEIGFRDEFIYNYLKTVEEEKEDIIKLTCMKREEAIKVFEEYKKNPQKINY